jgi:hypothetical protein
MKKLTYLFKNIAEIFKTVPLTEARKLELKKQGFSSNASGNSDTKINPATGLHMIGGSDSMGNSFGSSGSDDHHRRNNDYHNHYSSSSSSHSSYDHWNR